MFFNKWRYIFSVMHKAGRGFLCIMTKRFSICNGIAQLGTFFMRFGRVGMKMTNAAPRKAEKKRTESISPSSKRLKQIAGII